MFQVEVTTVRGTRVTAAEVVDEGCIIGRAPDSAIVLQGGRVATRQARLSLSGQSLFLHDLAGRGDTCVNGAPVSTFGPLSSDDVIQIHDYRLRVAPRVMAISVLATDAAPPPATRVPQPRAEAADALPGDTEPALLQAWRVRLRAALHEQMDLRRINVSAMSDAELRELTTRLVGEILAHSADVPEQLDRARVLDQVVAEAVGLGPLEPLLARAEVSEIMVNAAREVFFECDGRIQRSQVSFTDDQAVQAIIQRIVAPLGRRIDESSPMVDGRLKDGSRVNAVIPPLALKGACLTIRKFMSDKLTAQHLVDFGSMSAPMVAFLQVAVRERRNVLISGGTGSGKTTLLNVLSNFIPRSERIVTIEDAAELRLHQPNMVSLEARPPNQEGRGAVSIRDLVRNALRMRPDRIVVGECRGGEALDMLQAMNTGHDGSLTTAHANSARDCLSRLEVMVMMSGMDLPVLAIREQIASAVQLIVQQTRFACGARKVTAIAEVTGIENGRIQLAEVFRFRQGGYDGDGRVQGRFEATGLVPEFYEQLARRGIGLDLSIFEPEAAP